MNHREFEELPAQTDDQLEYSGRGITLMTVLLAVLKRPWIVFVSLLVVMLPLIYYLLSMVPIYMSTATVMVSVKGVSFLDAVSLVEGSKSTNKTQKYYTSILDSREYRDDIVNQVIATFPEMPRDSVAGVINIEYKANPREEGFLNISAISQKQKFAFFLAQAAVDNFRNRSIYLERQDAENVSKFIGEQIANVNQKMEKAQEALQSFLRKNKFIASETEMGVGQELLDLEKNLSDAEAGLEMITMNIDSYDKQIKELLSQLSSTYKEDYNQEDVTLKARVEEIRDRLGKASALGLTADEIEELRKERNQIVSQIVRSVSLTAPNGEMGSSYSGMNLLNLEKELEAALIEEERYKNQVNFYKIQIDRFMEEHPNISKDILEYAGLVRARDVLKSTIDILLEKREEARIRVASEQGGVKVIDKPRLPKYPVPRKRSMKLIMGIIGALGLGIIICVIIDRFDDSVKDENEIQQLGLPVFGTIPLITQSKSASESFLQMIKKDGDPGKEEIRLLTSHSEKSPVAEAYRSLKTSLSFIATDKSKKIFVISSPGSSEGKSLTTANLAISFAQGGSNTLIIDCDLRRATQHKYFEMERKPGLTNYLYSEVPLQDIIKKTPLPNLHLITAGSSPPNPAELAASGKMASFLKEIRSEYDIILIDTPPIMACVDSRVLAGRGDGMILIAKVESTSYKAVLHAVNLSRRLNVEILGVILNQTEMRYGYGYYYAYRYYNPYSYYYSGYSYYYQEDEATGERVKKRAKVDKHK